MLERPWEGAMPALHCWEGELTIESVVPDEDPRCGEDVGDPGSRPSTHMSEMAETAYHTS